jgi:hypothetical protein
MKRLLGTLLCCLTLAGFMEAQPLEAGFRNPPDWSRPWVYWFWLNGNITREGITADLEAMQRVGIGGVLIMEVDQGVPPGSVPFASPQWRELFQHVVSEAHRLGHEHPGIRHFSGTATYRTSVRVPASLLQPGQRVYLHLGRVEVVASVRINGKLAGVLWKSPFRADVTGLLRPGENQIEVRVANLWVNRMIGDEQLPEDSHRNPDGTLREWPAWLLEGRPSPTGRYTFTTWRLWQKDSPLQPSGLLGPVRMDTTRLLTLR